MADFDKHWDFQHPDKTEQKFRELLPEAEGERRLELLTQIARTLGLQKRFDESHRLLDEVERELTDGAQVARIRLLLERGRAFRSSGQPDRGEPVFLQAWELAREHKEDHYAVDAAHMVALVVAPDERIGWSEKAMVVAEQSEDARARGWLGTLYNNIGWEYHDRGEFEKAHEVHRKGWQWHQERNREAGVETSRGERIAKWSVGKQLRGLERIDEALAIQRELERAYEKLEEPDGFVFEEIGECLLAQDGGDAQPYFARAHALLKEIDWIEPDRLARIAELAEGK